MSSRTSALKNISNVQEWRTFNPVFELNTPQFDEAFSGEYGLDPDYYLLHNDTPNSSFEDRMANNLFSGHGNPDSKLYLLRGDLGTGKTTFVHYMGSSKLPESFGCVFFMYINCYNRFPKKHTTNENFNKIFLRIFKESLICKDPEVKEDWHFSSEAQLAQAVLSHRGVDGASGIEALRELNNCGADILLPFILYNFKFDRVLISIDNMDDCSDDVREIAFSFAQSLSDIVIECGGRQSNIVSILVPLRHYTNFSTDTEGYPRVDMPTHSISDVMRVKIDHVKDLIDKNHESNISEYIQSSMYRKREVNRRNGTIKIYWERSYSGRWVTVENISTLIKAFAKKSELEKKHGFLDVIKNLSGGNLKLVTRNTYNIFHSCKLNLSEIMQFVYTPEGSPEYNEMLEKLESASFGTPMIYDLTMAIHFPFFDKEASCIANLFNLHSSTAPNDWRNTLGLVRFLFFIYNSGATTFKDIKLAFESISYDLTLIEKAVVKSLDFCLLNTEHGTKLDHLNDETIIELSPAGIYMLEYSISSHRYLSYVCEDVMMEDKYIVEIGDKYAKGENSGNMAIRDESVNNFYSFLLKEELNEIKFVSNINGWSKESFLRDFSPKIDGTPVTLVEYIAIGVKKSSNIELQGFV